MEQDDQAVDPQALKAALADEFEQMADEVATAINRAGDDDVIGHSEYQVRDVMGAFRARVFERAVQMRLDAAQAAFSPSGEPAGGGVSTVSQGSSKPGGADGQRLDPD